MLLIITAILIIILVMIFRNPDLIEGLDSFNGRMAIDDQYFYDKVFDDVFYYANDEDGWVTGWDLCKLQCGGHCVEYGPSGNSYCFSY